MLCILFHHTDKDLSHSMDHGISTYTHTQFVHPVDVILNTLITGVVLWRKEISLSHLSDQDRSQDSSEGCIVRGN